MTGPPYPPPPVAGSNAIGSFVIGVSPIGDIRPFDPLRTVISQYQNSPILMQLVENMDDYIDQTTNLSNFFDLVWNVDTAQGWGLDVWGRIVGVSRVIPVTGTGTFLGFAQAVGGGSIDTFGFGPFFLSSSLTNNASLTDTAFRTLIFAKALANISDGSIPGINQILLNLFPGRGNCYVIDNGDMSMVYKFDFAISAVELAIVNASGVLPKPIGVAATVESLP